MGRMITCETVPALDGTDDIPALAEFRITRLNNQSIMHVTTEDGQRLAAHIRYLDEAAWVHHEASQNAAAMVLHTRQQNDFGARQIAAMIRRGAHPDIRHSHVTYDPATGDYGYLLQFPKRAPVPLLLSEAEMDLIRVKQWVARNRASR